jgi:hypothetical protein
MHDSCDPFIEQSLESEALSTFGRKISNTSFELLPVGAVSLRNAMFISLEAARLGAMEVGLTPWQIFHGNVRLEHHHPMDAGGDGWTAHKDHLPRESVRRIPAPFGAAMQTPLTAPLHSQQILFIAAWTAISGFRPRARRTSSRTERFAESDRGCTLRCRPDVEDSARGRDKSLDTVGFCRQRGPNPKA